MDHDQLFKELLHHFLPDLVALRLPQWLDKFDFAEVEWLEQEVFPDPPAGKRRAVDLLARVKVKEELPPLRPGDQAAAVLLIHIEIESEDSSREAAGQLFAYHNYLRDKHGLRVLSLALFLKVGLAGLGWGEYREELFGEETIHFRYPYVGLPALDGLGYLYGDNWLGVALAALMKIPPPTAGPSSRPRPPSGSPAAPLMSTGGICCSAAWTRTSDSPGPSGRGTMPC